MVRLTDRGEPAALRSTGAWNSKLYLFFVVVEGAMDISTFTPPIVPLKLNEPVRLRL
jgi:hypothetical protein